MNYTILWANIVHNLPSQCEVGFYLFVSITVVKNNDKRYSQENTAWYQFEYAIWWDLGSEELHVKIELFSLNFSQVPQNNECYVPQPQCNIFTAKKKKKKGYSEKPFVTLSCPLALIY